jgi:hypothetical protein
MEYAPRRHRHEALDASVVLIHQDFPRTVTEDGERHKKRTIANEYVMNKLPI